LYCRTSTDGNADGDALTALPLSEGCPALQAAVNAAKIAADANTMKNLQIRFTKIMHLPLHQICSHHRRWSPVQAK